MTWSQLTEPQATILSSAFTIVGALAAVVLGSWLFSGRVKDLKTALDQSDGLLQAHKAEVQSALQQVTRSIGSIEEQLRTTLESLGQLRGSIGELESVRGRGETTNQASGVDTERQADARDALKNDWIAIRDQMEAIASDPKRDGRTIAKYARIDRRQYGELWKSLNGDQAFDRNALDFKHAIDLWQRFRSGRSAPLPADLEMMKSLRAKLTGT